jgi:hypothetical protein
VSTRSKHHTEEIPAPAVEPPLPANPANDPLAEKKLQLEIESLTQQMGQLASAKKKLELEVQVLASQVGGFGSFARIFWPVISALLTVILGLTAAFFTYRSQYDEASQKKRDIFLAAMHDASDEQKGADTRIAGLWSLGNYWDSEYIVLAANVLSTAISTGSDTDTLPNAELKQPIRLAAAEVVGGAISGNPYQFDDHQYQRAKNLSRLLYGVGQTGEPGVLTRMHLSLLQRRATLLTRHLDTSIVELKLIASREAIRKNWECLEGVNLRDHDLTGIRLYEGEMPFVTLAGATVKGADFNLANLYGADLQGLSEWQTATYERANIAEIRNAPQGLESWALDHHAVKMSRDSWKTWRLHGSPQPSDWEAWRKSGFAVDASGVPNITH